MGNTLGDKWKITDWTNGSSVSRINMDMANTSGGALPYFLDCKGEAGGEMYFVERLSALQGSPGRKHNQKY